MFERLEPPPGGLARLRARLDAPPSGQRWVWATAAVALAAAMVLTLLPRRQPGLEETLTVSSGAAMRVPTGDPRVLFYLVASSD